MRQGNLELHRWAVCVVARGGDGPWVHSPPACLQSCKSFLLTPLLFATRRALLPSSLPACLSSSLPARLQGPGSPVPVHGHPPGQRQRRRVRRRRLLLWWPARLRPQHRRLDRVLEHPQQQRGAAAAAAQQGAARGVHLWSLCYSHPAMIGRVSRPWAGGTRDQGASREGVDHGAPSPWLRPPSPQLSVPGSPHPGPAPRPAGHATPTTWWGTWGSLAA